MDAGLIYRHLEIQLAAVPAQFLGGLQHHRAGWQSFVDGREVAPFDQLRQLGRLSIVGADSPGVWTVGVVGVGGQQLASDQRSGQRYCATEP